MLNLIRSIIAGGNLRAAASIAATSWGMSQMSQQVQQAQEAIAQAEAELEEINTNIDRGKSIISHQLTRITELLDEIDASETALAESRARAAAPAADAAEPPVL